MRFLGIDYGNKRIGLSMSDSGGKIALPLDTLISKGTKADIDYLEDLVRQNGIGAIVLGFPKNMDGSEGDRANKTRAFGDILRRAINIDVIYKDERLSSMAAERVLNEAGVKIADHKGTVDKMAAQIILQSYLDSVNR